jgi:hypothetical protein
VCGLAHYFEDEGIPSTAIALMREHAETIRAPRSLWVPFELGRPLGAPDEPAFQRKVLSAALALLVSPDGPVVLEDFPDDAPGPKAEDSTGWVCPVSFPPPPSEDAGPIAELLNEIETLAPWYQLSRDRRGRTLVGVSEMAIPEAARYALSFLEESPIENPQPEKTRAQSFKDAFMDIMAYYSEAGTAQPGRRSSGDTQQWFWYDTAAGRLFLDVREKLLQSGDKKLKFVAAKIMLPKTQGG